MAEEQRDVKLHCAGVSSLMPEDSGGGVRKESSYECKKWRESVVGDCPKVGKAQ